MTKVYMKLMAMSLALILSVCVVLMSSYAWLVLSGNPAATGMHVAIGGGNTILTAPNMKVEANGVIYNIPGHFSDKMNFGQQDSYAYLKELGNLTPVSTSNGIDWFLPTYYSGNDELVQQGKVPSGALRDISEFKVDSFLNHANLTTDKKEQIDKGNYVYLDFWVVAPGGDYTLRVSTGDGTEDGGSFVIDLLECKNSETGYVLEEPDGSAAAAVRVGFLANDVQLTDETMLQYKQSRYFDNQYKALRGMYLEPNTGAIYSDADRFTIYEPNGDYHPANSELDGKYVETKSLQLVNGQIREKEISRENMNLTIQQRSTWASAGNGTQSAIEQRLQTARFAYLGEVLTEQELTDRLYGSYLQGQISTYVDKGSFVKNMGNMVSYFRTNGGVVTEDILQSKSLTGDIYAGATDDMHIIKLERNVPQRIRMFIWLEGQDIDCIDSISSARFAINIELAGGDQ